MQPVHVSDDECPHITPNLQKKPQPVHVSGLQLSGKKGSGSTSKGNVSIIWFVPLHSVAF